MKIAVLGASQGVGLELVKLALTAGHEVTALVREPGKPVVNDSRLTMAIGDIRDPSAVGNVVRGKDAVCICVGIPPTRKPVDVFSEGTRQVLAAMKSSPGIKLLAITGIGAGDSKGHGGFFYDRIINPLLLGMIYEDKNRQEALIKASDATWMIVRPGFLTNGPRTGTYRVIDDLANVTAGKISRADVADFMFKEIGNPTHFGKTPLLCYA